MRLTRWLALTAVVAACGSKGSSPSPVRDRVERIAIGGGHGCAVLSSGAVRCWGYNAYGELGNPAHLGDSSFVPLPVTGVSAPARLAAGGSHACANLASGETWCWGWGKYGQLGNGVWADSETPVTVSALPSPDALGAGFKHTCALAAGLVSCWGDDTYGQLGDPDSATSRAVPGPVAGISGASAIAVGGLHSCALLGGGAVECWGGPLNGSPAGSPYHAPVPIAGLSNVTALAAGYLHGCAVVAGDTVKCWGDNYYGQLGGGAAGGDHATAAIDVVGLGSATAVTAGNYHSCALLGDGTVACWGSNAAGQLGDGSFSDRHTPVAVTGLTGATTLAAGAEYTCAIVVGGSVKCWGNNYGGQLGLDPALVQTSAVPVTIHF